MAPTASSCTCPTRPAAGTPDFLNSHNDSRAQVNIPLAPGEYTFRLIAEPVAQTLPAELHFVLKLYFDGNQMPPDISGLTVPSGPASVLRGIRMASIS